MSTIRPAKLYTNQSLDDPLSLALCFQAYQAKKGYWLHHDSTDNQGDPTDWCWVRKPVTGGYGARMNEVHLRSELWLFISRCGDRDDIALIPRSAQVSEVFDALRALILTGGRIA